MIMTAVLFVAHFFKRKNTYTLLFSTAISEGIKDMFKEMGYTIDRVNKNANDQSNILSQNVQSLDERRTAYEPKTHHITLN